MFRKKPPQRPSDDDASAGGEPVLTTPDQKRSQAMANSSSKTTGFKPEISRRVSDIPGVAKQAAEEGQGHDPKCLVVGRDINLNGAITACDRLIVEGSVEASLTDCRVVEIAASGQFKGDATVEQAEISGRFEGNLSVHGRLLVRAGGSVSGDISYGELEVECGGDIKGSIDKAAATTSPVAVVDEAAGAAD